MPVSSVLAALAALSLLLVLVSVVLIPRALIRLPEDALTARIPRLRERLRAGGRAAVLAFVGRNLLASLLLLAGLLMLVTPGQGMLTVVAALAVADFPGRRRLVRRLLHNRLLARAVQSLRLRAGAPPLKGIPQPPQRPLV